MADSTTETRVGVPVFPFRVPLAADADASPIEAMKNACTGIAQADAGDVNTITSLYTKMVISYYEDVRRQAQQSFFAALAAAAVGTAFFFVALATMDESWKNASLIGGGLIQVISGINFYLYARASKQFATFHVCLERANRYVLANALCENLGEVGLRDQTRSALIDLIATAPMITIGLTADGVAGTPPAAARTGAKKPEQAAG
jgi:hypothetical protein